MAVGSPVLVRYSNFDLRVDLASGGVRVGASWPATGEGVGPIRSPLPTFAVKPGVGGESSRGAREVRISDRPLPGGKREIGRELFHAIFPREIFGLWGKVLGRAKKERTGVRLRLHLSRELWDWPWEWLFDDHKGFLALMDPFVSIVRFIDDAPPPRPFRGVLRIRVLVVAAQPQGQERLEVEEEWREIQRGLAGLRRWGRVHLEKLETPTLSGLGEKLAAETFHVLHFIGHGGVNTEGEGVLFFEGSRGEPVPVNGLQFGAVLKLNLKPSVRLVVLNACEGARDGTLPFAGVAQSLVLQQIPAVIAMKHPIRDQDAVRFSRRFYTGLSRGGSVDRALSLALIGLQADDQGTEWSTPVLYLQVADGILFPWPWKQIAAMVLSLLLVALAFASPSLIGPEAPPYPGPPAPSLPPTASEEGCPRSKLLRMSFVRIPEGTFTMGSRPRAAGEMEHEVTISKPFCMSVYEVTRGQYRKIMGAAPGKAGSSDDLPVTEVSWKDAQKFLRRLNHSDPGAGYRLASEAEWEYAARGRAPTDFGFGDDPDELSKYGNCKASDGHEGLAPAGSFLPNAWGLYDMHGNASEWVQDWYAPYPDKHETDPMGPATGDEKVRRGGSFEISPKNCSAVFRNQSRPSSRRDDVGFRLVRPVVQEGT